MLPFRKILVATDFSESSERALETAAAFATHFGAELVVLHVVEESAYASPFPMPPGVRDAAKARLDESVAGLRRRLLSASSLLREGVAWEEICASASQTSAGLVVVGSQGRHGLPRLVLGSVAERVVRMAPAPVLTVHPSDHVAILAGGMDRFRHLLAPTDFSDASRRGVDTAAELALELGAALTLVHVVEPSSSLYLVPDEAVAEAEAQARRQLEDLVAHLQARVPNVEGLTRRGVPWRRILEVGKERRADLVVLSTHGRRGFSRVFTGSVAEPIVRLSHVPVLTVGPGAAGAARVAAAPGVHPESVVWR